MSKAVGLAIMAAGVALAVVIGQRMSTDAMAVVVGVVVGVFASIPTSLLVMAAMRRGQPSYDRREEEARRPYHQPPPQPPQVFIVNPSQLPSSGYRAPGLPAPEAGYPPAHQIPDVSRRYKVVGDDGDSEIDTGY